MAFQGPAYGDLARRNKKIQDKRDPALENEVMCFVRDLSGESVDVDDIQCLKDGKALCIMINKFVDHPVKLEAGNTPFKHRANVENFIKACQQMELKEHDIFQVSDLTEAKNLPQVATCICALGRKLQNVPGYSGPCLGPKQAQENKREFTQEQMDAGKHVHSLQMGSNKGASQAGQSFGAPRQIINQ